MLLKNLKVDFARALVDSKASCWILQTDDSKLGESYQVRASPVVVGGFQETMKAFDSKLSYWLSPGIL